MGYSVPPPPPGLYRSMRRPFVTYMRGENGPELFFPNVHYSRRVQRNELHDGGWFIDQSKHAAREATVKFMILVSVIAIFAKAMS